ncbi:hypothetical protein LMG29542_07978 [Paraburkholderia humisilvae]|uniref:Aldehyde oxidase/xanthine dehydrogenase second molybdopterin binding domain-containing protein n=1 Tax=Paraburkholderia humisilvae TaxID=627669 RepID=A0A6J5F6U4_9BURK|nr:hypothetical protein LMG29542_07978 [Paraburkholderia humisilvae]
MWFSGLFVRLLQTGSANRLRYPSNRGKATCRGRGQWRCRTSEPSLDHGVRQRDIAAARFRPVTGRNCRGHRSCAGRVPAALRRWPRNETWNFNRYKVPLASDVAVWKQTGEVLPALSESDPPRGVAEVVMNAVVGAIAHATAHRFRHLSVTPKKIQEALA